MTKEQKKQGLEVYLNEYKKSIEKLIDTGQDDGLHPVELIYSVASTGLLAATLQAEGLSEQEIVERFKSLADKTKELVDESIPELDAPKENRVTVKKETLH